MRSLQERLDKIKKAFGEKAPDEAKKVMTRATEELRASGILDRIPDAGEDLPPFELPDTRGETVRSADLLQKGPLVVTVYRGVW